MTPSEREAMVRKAAEAYVAEYNKSFKIPEFYERWPDDWSKQEQKRFLRELSATIKAIEPLIRADEARECAKALRGESARSACSALPSIAAAYLLGARALESRHAAPDTKDGE